MAKETIRQIIRIDGRGCFLEVMNNAFDIGKVLINFIEYDVNKNKGERYKQEVNIYIDIPVFAELCRDIMSGKINKLATDERAKGKTYCDSIYTDMGGTSAKTLEKRGQARADGKSVSRQFKIIPGNKAPFMLVAESGVGEENEKGLIVPRYGTKPDQLVRIPCTASNIKQIAIMFEYHYQAYLSTRYIVEATAPSTPNNK